METFARCAFLTIVRDASFSVLAGAILVVAYSYSPPLALVIGGSVAMLFTIVMLVRAVILTDDKLVRIEPWSVMQPEELPQGDSAVTWAREKMEAMLFRAAKNGAAVASAMFGLGLLTSWA
jgi:hypothetical protein